MTNFPKVARQIILKSRPAGIPQAENFGFAEAKIPELADGQILVRNEYLSVDPAMRGWVSAVANYSTPVGIGEVMRSFASGKVVASKHKDYAEGESVTGLFGWQDYAVVDAGAITRKVMETDLPLSLSLGVLGLNGITAYFGLLDNGLPRPGDTVVVSTAAGAVGSAVGQIAKLMGCRTVGIAGGPTKTKLCLDEFGYDVAIDYKAARSIDEQLADACPDGVDVYFDNTSGPISDAVMARLSVGARVSGFIIFDYQHRYMEAVKRLAEWVRDGKLRYREEISDGIEHCPPAIAELYRGENLGKKLIRLQA